MFLGDPPCGGTPDSMKIVGRGGGGRGETSRFHVCTQMCDILVIDILPTTSRF